MSDWEFEWGTAQDLLDEIDRLRTTVERLEQERKIGRLVHQQAERWQEMAEDLWEELQEWHDQADCPTFDGGDYCTCHRILADAWDQITHAAEYADEDVKDSSSSSPPSAVTE